MAINRLIRNAEKSPAEARRVRGREGSPIPARGPASESGEYLSSAPAIEGYRVTAGEATLALFFAGIPRREPRTFLVMGSSARSLTPADRKPFAGPVKSDADGAPREPVLTRYDGR